MKRARLVLARETLVRLGPDDLAEVNGGSISHTTCVTQHTGLTVCTVCDFGIAHTHTCVTCTCA